MESLAIYLVLAPFGLAVVALLVLWRLDDHRLPGKPIRYGNPLWIVDSLDRSGYDRRGMRLYWLYVVLTVLSSLLLISLMATLFFSM